MVKKCALRAKEALVEPHLEVLVDIQMVAHEAHVEGTQRAHVLVLLVLYELHLSEARPRHQTRTR